MKQELVNKALDLYDLNVKLIGKKFYAIWGYDQTNYNFVMVVGISESGKYAICRTVKVLGSRNNESEIYPTDEVSGDLFKLKIENDTENGEIRLRGSYIYSGDKRKDKWGNDCTRLATLWEVKKDQRFWESMR